MQSLASTANSEAGDGWSQYGWEWLGGGAGGEESLSHGPLSLAAAPRGHAIPAA